MFNHKNFKDFFLFVFTVPIFFVIFVLYMTLTLVYPRFKSSKEKIFLIITVNLRLRWVEKKNNIAHEAKNV